MSHLQPFRFISLGAEELQAVDAEVTVAANAIFGIQNGGIENGRSWFPSSGILPGIVVGNSRLPLSLARPESGRGDTAPHLRADNSRVLILHPSG